MDRMVEGVKHFYFSQSALIVNGGDAHKLRQLRLLIAQQVGQCIVVEYI